MKTKNELFSSKVGVAVSGGADSIYLLQNYTKYAKDIVVLHVNHQTRPECVEEALFVKEQCELLGVEFVELLAEGLSLDMPNFEDKARKERHRLFLEYATQNNISHILTAHHQDDLVETVLLKAFRGSLNLFIPRYRPLDRQKTVFLVRPLLDISRKQIESFLSQNDILYKDDPSNKDNKYLRNYLRNAIIPMLSSKIPNFAQKIRSLAIQKQEEEDFLVQYSKSQEKKLFINDECELSEFLDEHVVIQQRILQNKLITISGESVSRGNLLSIIEILTQENTHSAILWQDDRFQLIKDKNKMRFILKNPQITLEKKQFIIHNNKIHYRVLDYKIDIVESGGICYDINDTIYLKTTNKDDRILWNNGTKKITQLFKDKKISLGYVIIKNNNIIGVVSPSYTYIVPHERATNIGLYISKI